MKKITIYGLFLCLLSCATPPLAIKTISEYSPKMYFDNILDEKITTADPRIQSITGVYRDYPGSTIIIECSNEANNIQLANRLFSIFKTEQITLDNPNCKDNSMKKVTVKIHFAFNESNKENNKKGKANGNG